MYSTIPFQIDLGASLIPHVVFDLIHIVLLIVVSYLGYNVLKSEDNLSKVGYGFGLFVLGEISYIGYHLGITTFLLSHTISEVLVFIAFILIFLGLKDRGLVSL